MAISQSYQGFNNNNNFKIWENQQKSGGNFCVCPNNSLIVATKNGKLRFKLINGLLSVVGCRCWNVCTKTCITCLMLKKSRKKLKKRKKCRRTQITLFINQQMLSHTVRCEVTHFFPFKMQKMPFEHFFGHFFVLGIFLNFFSNLFSRDFLWYFSLHMPNISHERFLWLRRAFHTTAVELFFEFYWMRHWFSSHFKGLSLVNLKKKNQPIFKLVNRCAFSIPCGIFSRKKEKLNNLFKLCRWFDSKFI